MRLAVLMLALACGGDVVEDRPDAMAVLRTDARPGVACKALVPDDERHCYTACCRVGGVNASVQQCAMHRCRDGVTYDGESCQVIGVGVFDARDHCLSIDCEPCQ
jgi:hypothetical protein